MTILDEKIRDKGLLGNFVAEKIECTPAHLSRMRHGKAIPNKFLRKRLLVLFPDLKEEDLLGGGSSE